MIMHLPAILNDPHFCNLVAILRIPCLLPDWQTEETEVQFSARMKKIEALMTREQFEQTQTRAECTHLFIALLHDLQRADFRLHHTQDDIQWFIATMDQDYALVTLSLLLACAYADESYMTPQEIAQQTATAPDCWRDQARAGAFPGALKKGRVWYILRSLLTSRGILQRVPE
jgi:hypothetical protein